MNISLYNGLTLYTIILVAVGVIAVLSELLWRSNHTWSISRSKLLSCRKCGNVYLLKRQQVDRRCPQCGANGGSFRMPYSGAREVLKQRAGKLRK
ncbi:MAG: hypothetical protein J6S21_01520 [Victivallales bacterium]|nr:hypothetical protein [Victivallales bacterium]